MDIKKIQEPIEILMVEDNPGDVLLTVEALKDIGLADHINVVEDGLKALAFLRKEGEYTNKPKPDLILLDLNLPKKDGREVLLEIKNAPSFKDIPLIIFSTSACAYDIIESYNLHIDGYINKSADFTLFSKVIHDIVSKISAKHSN